MQDDLFSAAGADPAAGAADPVAARAEWLRRELERHTVLYYRDAAPEIPDSEFDAMMRELAALEAAHPELRTPDSPTQRVGGAPSEGFEKYAHAIPMQSLENTYDRADLADFDSMVRTITGLDAVDYVVEPKVDGLAFCAIYEKGALTTSPPTSARSARSRSASPARPSASRRAARSTCPRPASSRSPRSRPRAARSPSRTRATPPPARSSSSTRARSRGARSRSCSTASARCAASRTPPRSTRSWSASPRSGSPRSRARGAAAGSTRSCARSTSWRRSATRSRSRWTAPS